MGSVLIKTNFFAYRASIDLRVKWKPSLPIPSLYHIQRQDLQETRKFYAATTLWFLRNDFLDFTWLSSLQRWEKNRGKSKKLPQNRDQWERIALSSSINPDKINVYGIICWPIVPNCMCSWARHPIPCTNQCALLGGFNKLAIGPFAKPLAH